MDSVVQQTPSIKQRRPLATLSISDIKVTLL